MYRRVPHPFAALPRMGGSPQSRAAPILENAPNQQESAAQTFASPETTPRAATRAAPKAPNPLAGRVPHPFAALPRMGGSPQSRAAPILEIAPTQQECAAHPFAPPETTPRAATRAAPKAPNALAGSRRISSTAAAGEAPPFNSPSSSAFNKFLVGVT
jgi:hypothetical protein